MIRSTTTRFAFLASLALVGCGDGCGEAEPSEHAEVASETSPVAPEPAPAPPSEGDLALAAFEEGRYDDVCPYLVKLGFDQGVCAWIAESARAGKQRDLGSREFRRFLEGQRVKKRYGRIVSFYDEANNEYEVRIGGKTSILAATETAFSTTGNFSMWTQPYGTSQEVLMSGREVDVPIYREWPLQGLVRELVAAKPSESQPLAKALLREILENWEMDYCYSNPNEGMDCIVEEE